MAAPKNFFQAGPSTPTTQLINDVLRVARANGYTVGYMVQHIVGDNTLRCNFQLKSLTQTKYEQAHIEIAEDIFGSSAKVHQAQGFPDALFTQLLNLSAFAPLRPNSQGVQAVRQDDPPQPSDGGELADEEDEGAGEAEAPGQTLAKTAVALIEISNVMLYKNETRRYVGASGIGDPCQAYHALCMRGFPSDVPEASMIRIFREGKRLESVVIDDLKAAGHEVHEVDPSTGQQWCFTSLNGHHRANLDGMIKLVGDEALRTLEIKSMRQLSFNALIKHGLKKAEPGYYAQVQDGMQLAVRSHRLVNSCVFVAICKNNQKYHIEIIERDQVEGDRLEKVARDAIIDLKATRAARFEASWQCQKCFKKTSCWSPEMPLEAHCSHCRHSRPLVVRQERSWQCTLHQRQCDQVCENFQLFRVEQA